MSSRDSLPPQAPRRIKALDQNVVNKIAAGEVIVAPVHALKELTENAVDAGSTSIEVLVKDGGLKLLQITDNGHGINRDDLPILAERFTTSKLKAFEDLTSIGTYGFRGEALASISHIAHLRVTTRTKESSCAWQGHYQDGKLVDPKSGQSAESKATAGRQGTQITVEDLFYNIPTRRKAFRSASEEYAKILDLIGKYAIHCGGVAFTCKKHGDPSMGITVQQAANTVERIRTIHGSPVANELIEVEAKSERWGFKADGWISNANYHVKKLVLLLFINHRSVESTAIKKAVEQTFSTFLPKGGHPFIYLSLEIEPHRVDVNVHPTKREVHFLHEEEIIDVVCEEIRARLGKVDTSRTYMTQSLLHGVKIPTISTQSMNTPRKSTPQGTLPTPGPSTHKQATQQPPQRTPKTPAPKTNENNFVRTDANLRKITSMLPPAQRASQSRSRNTVLDNPPNDKAMPALPSEDSIDYTYIEREVIVCRLSSVKALRASVRDAMHSDLTEIFATHTFVGIIDEYRRIAAIQSGTKLLLVDYGMVCNEYFYQVGLTDFGNFGYMRFDPPLALGDLLQIGANSESEANTDPNPPNWDEVREMGEAQLINQRAMLSEYFAIEISEDGYLLGLPMLTKGWAPPLTKLPRLLIRLGPFVDWTNEQACFRSILRELASWCVPEMLTPAPSDRSTTHSTQVDADLEMGGTDGSDITLDQLDEEDADVSRRRREVHRAVEHVLFPAFRQRLIATRGMEKGVIEVANLKGLYRVFERC